MTDVTIIMTPSPVGKTMVTTADDLRNTLINPSPQSG
jgi:hypothetical protein